MIVLVMIPRGGGVCGRREGSTRDREMINAMSEGQIATQARCDITGITHCAFSLFSFSFCAEGFSCATEVLGVTCTTSKAHVREKYQFFAMLFRKFPSFMKTQPDHMYHVSYRVVFLDWT